VSERSFEVPVEQGVLVGHRGGVGPPALLLHGGAALPDYLGDCADLLADRFTTYRYTQRGTPPSAAGPPYTVEAHVADALAVLDAFEIERAWAVGHSWGGHLALHLLVARPERVLGVICVGTLGADGGIFEEYEQNLARGMTDEEIGFVRETQARRRAGDVSEADLVEVFRIVWPRFFRDAGKATAPPEHVGAQASIETNRSLAEHFARATLKQGLPSAKAPVLFIHGEHDPMPIRTARETAALIDGARVEPVAGAAHFPWVEQPAAFRRAVEAFLAEQSASPAGDRGL
jgi:pimeloyl-ACP methyl ester carboxylesterase